MVQPKHRRTQSAHEYEEEEDSDDRMPPEATAVGGRTVGARGWIDYYSDVDGAWRDRRWTSVNTRK